MRRISKAATLAIGLLLAIGSSILATDGPDLAELRAICGPTPAALPGRSGPPRPSKGATSIDQVRPGVGGGGGPGGKALGPRPPACSTSSWPGTRTRRAFGPADPIPGRRLSMGRGTGLRPAGLELSPKPTPRCLRAGAHPSSSMTRSGGSGSVGASSRRTRPTRSRRSSWFRLAPGDRRPGPARARERPGRSASEPRGRLSMLDGLAQRPGAWSDYVRLLRAELANPPPALRARR